MVEHLVLLRGFTYFFFFAPLRSCCQRTAKRRRRRAKGVNRQWKLQRLDVAEDDVGGHKAVAREAERAAMAESTA